MHCYDVCTVCICGHAWQHRGSWQKTCQTVLWLDRTQLYSTRISQHVDVVIQTGYIQILQTCNADQEEWKVWKVISRECKAKCQCKVTNCKQTCLICLYTLVFVAVDIENRGPFAVISPKFRNFRAERKSWVILLDHLSPHWIRETLLLSRCLNRHFRQPSLSCRSKHCTKTSHTIISN